MPSNVSSLCGSFSLPEIILGGKNFSEFFQDIEEYQMTYSWRVYNVVTMSIGFSRIVSEFSRIHKFSLFVIRVNSPVNSWKFVYII